MKSEAQIQGIIRSLRRSEKLQQYFKEKGIGKIKTHEFKVDIDKIIRKLYPNRVKKSRKNRLSREAYNTIVYMREVQRMTLQEVGDAFNLTRERIRQITQPEPRDWQ